MSAHVLTAIREELNRQEPNFYQFHFAISHTEWGDQLDLDHWTVIHKMGEALKDSGLEEWPPIHIPFLRYILDFYWDLWYLYKQPKNCEEWKNAKWAETKEILAAYED